MIVMMGLQRGTNQLVAGPLGAIAVTVLAYRNGTSSSYVTKTDLLAEGLNH